MSSTVIQPNSTIVRTTPQNIFVYGTLKKGHGNHDYFLKKAKFLGNGRIEGIMFHIGGFPAISLAEKFSSIVGEVYEVDWEDITRMDRLEGVPHHYNRIQTIIYPYSKCWTYIYPHGTASLQKKVIPTGEWLGPDTPASNWLGWNKGIEVDSMETEEDNIIRLNSSGNHSGRWILKKSKTNDQYVLIDTKDNNKVLGMYNYFGQVRGSDGKMRHKLCLPRSTGNGSRTVDDLVKEQVTKNVATNPNIQGPPFTSSLPAIISTIQQEPSVPQAADVLGVKVEPA